MPLPELVQTSTKWLFGAGLSLSLITLIAFLVRWGQSFRLVGITSFTLLLAASSWAFSAGYTPPTVVSGALYVPIVFDNGGDLVVAQASLDFPEQAIKPTLEQLAGNLQGGGRNGGMVHIRLRKVDQLEPGVSKPVVIGEAIQDLKANKTQLISKE